ncbi:hypothetical protein M5C90_10665 [Pseudomonas chlororaphis subsp. piscium]|nr:hypothetical protein M5C90_10665 [Pseudomonas chlororaphis subsp. piscium]
MSIIEVVSPGDRRSLIKRYERKTKSEAIRELIDLHFCNLQQIELLEGIKPSPPQRPPEDYGLPDMGFAGMDQTNHCLSR